MRIFLIGMPGSGKSTLGKAVAEHFHLSYLDLDKEIESEESLSIAEIFERKGEPYFRELESATLKKITSTGENVIIATGGGAPCFFDNMDYMMKQGTVIYITAPIDALAERLKNENNRPLLKGKSNLKESLEELLSKRIAVYERAHFTVVNLAALENIVSDLMKR